MKELNIKAGEQFIYVSKYGGVVKGVIESFTELSSVDAVNGACTKSYGIKSTNGICYNLNEIDIVTKFLTEQECMNIGNNIKKLRGMKIKMYKSLPNINK